MYPEVFEAKKIFNDNEFHLKLFDASVANYFELNNPIRFNNFCYSIRELLREKLDSESPDNEILLTPWYEKNNREKPTRADKIRYYIAKGLINENIPELIYDKLQDCLEDFRKLMEVLNKYTHINNKSFGINFNDGDKWFRKSIKLLNNFINTIESLEREIETKLIEKIQLDIEDKLIQNLPSEIDMLSTHSYIDEVTDVELKIEDMNYESINISGNCNVGVELVYGSESDREGEDEQPFTQSYPMKFNITIDINNLENREYELDEIDTSEFYE